MRHQGKGRRKRLRDLLLYALVGLAVVVTIVIYAPYGRAGDGEIFGKWLGLAGNTLILFGYSVKSNRRLWRLLPFWISLAACLVLHLAVFIWILLVVDQWKVLWFLIMYPVETPLIEVAVNWAVRSRKTRILSGL